MQVDEVVKALKCLASYQKEFGVCFISDKRDCQELLAETTNLLERLQAKLEAITKDRDQWKMVAEASRDVIQPKLRAEIAELKASQIRRINYESCTLCDSEYVCGSKTVKECKDRLLEACGTDMRKES